MKVSEVGIELIKRFEGFRARRYKGIGHGENWVIGYGHVIRKGENIKEPLTEKEATQLLISDLERWVVPCIQRSVRVPLQQYQIDALASFIYNVGCGAFRRSTLLRKLNSRDYVGAANEFLRWVYYTDNSGRKVKSEGLVRRRAAEKSLFEGAITDFVDKVRENVERSQPTEQKDTESSKNAVMPVLALGGLLLLMSRRKKK